MVSTHPLITNAERLASLSRQDLLLRDQDTTEKTQLFEIHHVKRSENALLLFNDRYVFKILQSYKDCRYSQKELAERHACLIEGWHWNRLFRRNIHLGLARLYNLGPERDKLSPIVLGEFLNPDQEPLDKEAEYVLVMRKLPKIYRLDVMLEVGNNESQQNCITILTQFLAHIHANPAFPSVKPDGDKIWGSITQLKDKLIDNLATVEKSDITDEVILGSTEYRLLRSTCESLKETLVPIFTNDVYQHYFAQRVKNQKIRRCHGDLKARNIWIMPSSNPQDSSCPENLDDVRLLDAIDFNPDFCNIDTLSDFAMLVADIHTRTLVTDIHTRANSSELDSSMIEDYLRLTKQQDDESRFVLSYYLVEKAFVGALVSILYDNHPRLGQNYLAVCGWYLAKLKNQMLPAERMSPVLVPLA